MAFGKYKDLEIHDNGNYSQLCLENGYKNFGNLLRAMQEIPYGRNSNNEIFSLVFHENRGTCATKHAFLYELIKEQKWQDWQLFLGLYIIDSENTQEVDDLLLDSGILELPNAHVYLKYKGEVIDVTKVGSEKLLFKNSLIKEEVIESNQISDYKSKYLKRNVKEWFQQSELGCTYSYDAILGLREQIILQLSF